MFVISRADGEGFFCAARLCPALRRMPRVAELPGLSGRSGWVLGSGWAGLGGVGGGLSAVCSPGRVEAGTPWVQAPQVSRLEELGSGVTSPRTGGRQPQVRLLPGQAGQWSVMSVAESPGQPAGAAAQRRGPGEKQPLLQSCTSGVLPWGGVSPQGLSPSPGTTGAGGKLTPATSRPVLQGPPRDPGHSAP